MTNQNQALNPVVASAAGIVVGANVAAPGVVVLEDKKTQEKIKLAFANMQRLAEKRKRLKRKPSKASHDK